MTSRLAGAYSREVRTRAASARAEVFQAIFGMNGSIAFGRLTGPLVGRPASLIRAYRRTVFGSTPAGAAAECAHSVASRASKLSMISLSDFFTIPPEDELVRCQAAPSQPPEGSPVRN